MIADHYKNEWNKDWTTSPWNPDNYPKVPIPITTPSPSPFPSKKDIKEFKKQVKQLEELLKKAKKYDEDNGEKDCELEDKKRVLQDIADKFGITINFP